MICERSITLARNGYLNPPGGIELFDKEEFMQGSIKLQFLRNNLKAYSQRRLVFEAGLSIIGIMIFCSREEIKGIVVVTNYLNR